MLELAISILINHNKSMRKNLNYGKIVTPAKANPWPHEQRIAKILATAGYYVEFIPETSIKTPDIYLNYTTFEIKSPVSDKINAVERNVTRALKKCRNIIFDSSRMKIRDKQILCELIKIKKRGKGLKKILFVTKQKRIIDIDTII